MESRTLNGRPRAARIAAGLLVTLGSGTIGTAAAQTEFFDDWRPLPAHIGQTRAPLANQSSRLFVDVVASGLEAPYGLAFLSDGRMLVAETPGRIRSIDTEGRVSEPITGLPAIHVAGTNAQGLHDIALHPQFERNRLLYFAYAEPPAEADAEPRNLIGRARLSSDLKTLDDVEAIFEANTRRIVFAPDGTIFLSTTAAGENRPAAQDLMSPLGKVLRINDDGSIPADNPFVGRADALPAVYTLGHRDPSGAAIHPRTGELWTIEHGPRGGDELNVARAGRNYGWPLISYGRNYDQTPIGDGLTAQDGLEQPIYFWVPSIAPSSLMFYTGDLFPDWQGNAFVSALSGEHIARLVLVGDHVAAEERLLVGREQRIRTVAQGPDGAVYVLTTGGTGELLRLRPKPPPGLFTD